jgi:hypothetical protein
MNYTKAGMIASEGRWRRQLRRDKGFLIVFYAYLVLNYFVNVQTLQIHFIHTTHYGVTKKIFEKCIW